MEGCGAQERGGFRGHRRRSRAAGSWTPLPPSVSHPTVLPYSCIPFSLPRVSEKLVYVLGSQALDDDFERGVTPSLIYRLIGIQYGYVKNGFLSLGSIDH